MIIVPRVLNASRPKAGGFTPEVRKEYEKIFAESEALDRTFAIFLIGVYIGLPIAMILIFNFV